MHRFFVPPQSIEQDSVTLPQHVARQLSRVLRASVGDSIIIFDNSGFEYVVTLENLDSRTAMGTVTDRRQNFAEPQTQIVLYQGTLKSDRFEYVLQKGTEVGISAFVPVICTRSIVRPRDGKQSDNRTERWNRIITEAAEQSGRGLVPTLSDAVSFADSCKSVDGVGVIPWEVERSRSLKSALTDLARSVQKLSVFIGPEGGYTDEEIELAQSLGIVPVSLGKRILRAETAGVVTASAILYEFDELGV